MKRSCTLKSDPCREVFVPHWALANVVALARMPQLQLSLHELR